MRRHSRGARRYARCVVALLTLWCGSGCTQVIHRYLEYQPTPSPQKVADANSPHVLVEITDKRSTTVVMTETNGYFGEFKVEYEPYNDMARMIKDAFETELRNRGFVGGEGGNVVLVSISFYRADRLHTSLLGDVTSSIGLDVTVKRFDGAAAYNRFVLGQNQPWETEHPPEDKYKHMVTNAMAACVQDALAKAFNDPAFLSALKT